MNQWGSRDAEWLNWKRLNKLATFDCSKRKTENKCNLDQEDHVKKEKYISCLGESSPSNRKKSSIFLLCFQFSSSYAQQQYSLIPIGVVDYMDLTTPLCSSSLYARLLKLHSGRFPLIWIYLDQTISSLFIQSHSPFLFTQIKITKSFSVIFITKW